MHGRGRSALEGPVHRWTRTYCDATRPRGSALTGSYCNWSKAPGALDILRVAASTSERVKDKGVRGILSTPEAIKKLLEGTGLDLSTDSTGAMLIAAPQAAAHTSATRPAPSGTEVSGERLAQSTSTSAQIPSEAANALSPNAADSRSTELPTAGLDEIVVTGTNISHVDNKTVALLALTATPSSAVAMPAFRTSLLLYPKMLKVAKTVPTAWSPASLAALTTLRIPRPQISVAWAPAQHSP
jgi:hypothetical protein